MKLLITGGCGFIGSNFIRYWLKNHQGDKIINLDKLTYAGHLSSTQDFQASLNYEFIQGDITDPEVVEKAMDGIETVVHFAAESHVDRSVIDPLLFIKTNVLGTGVLLDAALKHKISRFHHVSTDEIFGHLEADDPKFNEGTPYKPRTPYSASKAGSDHLVRAYFETYQLPITITNCANNYGPYHDPEKLIPRFITNLLNGQKVPLMGEGENIREWLYVDDHARAIEKVLEKGEIGETYCVGAEEKTNKEVTQNILKILGMSEEMVEYVEDRLGHDFRYAIDDSKIRKLGWVPEVSFEEGLKQTVEWYKNNRSWWEPLLNDRPSVDREAQKPYG
ncbi:MAG: dTDP-glucose 4,6-dehydratase [Candidatus Daviesbacteria bacterium]|nr:dTDP-glucose 4,6-dehydratase [Candidatus Daviesbacteria bacterium]